MYAGYSHKYIYEFKCTLQAAMCKITLTAFERSLKIPPNMLSHRRALQASAAAAAAAAPHHILATDTGGSSTDGPLPFRKSYKRNEGGIEGRRE